MKKNDFINRVQSMIDERQKKLASLTDEIEKLKNTINAQRIKVSQFTDVNDVETYSKLKRDLASNEDKLELLERNLKAGRATLDDGTAREIYNGFEKEGSEIDQHCQAVILPEIKNIQKVCDDARTEKEDLDRLFNKWKNTFDIPANQYTQSPCLMDTTGMTALISRLINSLKAAGKIE